MSDTEFDNLINLINFTHLQRFDKVLEVGEGPCSLVGLDLPAGTEVTQGRVATHVLNPF